MLFMNDTHLGVERGAGTTRETQKALQQNLLDSFSSELSNTEERDLTIVGDLFDGFSVSHETLLHTYRILSIWLNKQSNTLTLIAGNHDLSRNNSVISSFALLCELIRSRYPNQVQVVFSPAFHAQRGDVYIIPHMENQGQFDEALKGVPAGTKWLLLHANCTNHFAVNSDHSLNVNADQLAELPEGCVALFAHEHPHRVVSDRAICLGNQFPSSVSDALGGDRFIYTLNGSKLEKRKCWDSSKLVDIPWEDIDKVPEAAEFIRVTGECDYESYTAAIGAIATLRKTHKAFVISNAVSVKAGEVGEVDIESLEQAKSFDVLNFLSEVLDEPQMKKVLEVLND